MNIEVMRQLRESWIIHMEAAKTPRNTVLAYEGSLRMYLEWCAGEGITEDLEQPAQARLWLASLANAGRDANTINVRVSALRLFARWAVSEGELTESDMDRVKLARPAQKIPSYLTEEQRDALIATCAGKSFDATRDAAIISLMFDSMLRSDEVLSIRAKGDIDVRKRSVKVRRGKGQKERATGYGPETAMRLERYQRARARHKHAASDAYWLGKFGPWRYPGLYEMIRRRGELAGLGPLHPHMTRNGGAVQWKEDGGSTEGLMALGGWKSLEMVQHYVRAAEINLALAEQRRLFDKRR